MAKTTRTFVAIPIPQVDRREAGAAPGPAGPAGSRRAWTTTLPFHMTLAFLGDVAETDLNAVCKAVAQACRSVPRVRARLEGWEPSPAPQGRVSSGPGCGLPRHGCSRAAKGASSRPSQLGYRPDDERFTPHATLGRIRPDRRGPSPARPDRDPRRRCRTGPAARSRVGEVVTFASTLDPGRARLCPARPGPAHRGKPNAPSS